MDWRTKMNEPKSRRIPLTLKHMEPLGNGKFKIKLAETQINITDFRHEGVEYTILKNLGRGRYIAKKEM
jgi:hypothetical protein